MPYSESSTSPPSSLSTQVEVPPQPVFKNAGGHFLLKSLFYEPSGADKSHVVYSLKAQDDHGYPSLSRLYLDMSDVTEYEFSTKYLGGWPHWQKLTECAWFQPYVSAWRRELEIKIRAKALRRIQAEAASGSKNSYQANKFLVDKGWTPKETKGRPSKQQIMQEAKKQASEGSLVDEQYERLVVNGPSG